VKHFFFVKKKQKTFIHLRARRPPPARADSQSFFASFCSQKEDLP